MQCKWTVKITIFTYIHSQLPKLGRWKGNKKRGNQAFLICWKPSALWTDIRRSWDGMKQTSVKWFKKEGFRLWWAPDVFGLRRLNNWIKAMTVKHQQWAKNNLGVNWTAYRWLGRKRASIDETFKLMTAHDVNMNGAFLGWAVSHQPRGDARFLLHSDRVGGCSSV